MQSASKSTDIKEGTGIDQSLFQLYRKVLKNRRTRLQIWAGCRKIHFFRSAVEELQKQIPEFFKKKNNQDQPERPADDPGDIDVQAVDLQAAAHSK